MNQLPPLPVQDSVPHTPVPTNPLRFRSLEESGPLSLEKVDEGFTIEQVGYWRHMLSDEFYEFLGEKNYLGNTIQGTIDTIESELEDNGYLPEVILSAGIHHGLFLLGRIEEVVSSGEYTAATNISIEEALGSLKIHPDNKTIFIDLLKSYDFRTLLDIYIWGELVPESDDLSPSQRDLFMKYVSPKLAKKAMGIMEEPIDTEQASPEIRKSAHYHYHVKGVSKRTILLCTIILGLCAHARHYIDMSKVRSDVQKILDMTQQWLQEGEKESSDSHKNVSQPLPEKIPSAQ